MAEHDSQYLIELDGNKPPEELFMVSAMLSKNMSQFDKSKKYWLNDTYFCIRNRFTFWIPFIFEKFILTLKIWYDIYSSVHI